MILRESAYKLVVIAIVLLNTNIFCDENPDDPLAALVELSVLLKNESPESGGSIRAKTDKKDEQAKNSIMKEYSKKNNLYTAKVTKVLKGQKIYLYAIEIQILIIPKNNPFRNMIKEKDKIWVIPDMKIKDYRWDLNDIKTLALSSGYYLKQNDRIKISLLQFQNRHFTADYIEKI